MGVRSKRADTPAINFFRNGEISPKSVHAVRAAAWMQGCQMVHFSHQKCELWYIIENIM
jgi:hypothetical protein